MKRKKTRITVRIFRKFLMAADSGGTLIQNMELRDNVIFIEWFVYIGSECKPKLCK